MVTSTALYELVPFEGDATFETFCVICSRKAPYDILVFYNGDGFPNYAEAVCSEACFNMWLLRSGVSY